MECNEQRCGRAQGSSDSLFGAKVLKKVGLQVDFLTFRGLRWRESGVHSKAARIRSMEILQALKQREKHSLRKVTDKEVRQVNLCRFDTS